MKSLVVGLDNGCISVYKGTRTYIFELAVDFEDESASHCTLEQLEVLALRITCTLEQLEVLALRITEFVAKEKSCQKSESVGEKST